MLFVNKRYIFLYLILFTTQSIQSYLLTFSQAKQASALSNNFLILLQQHFGINCFFETGTLGGATTIRAATIFPLVHTVEIADHYFEQNRLKFSYYPNIIAHLGDSSELLPSIIDTTLVSKHCCFFLDAHYSGENSGKGKGNTPLLQEIKHIAARLPSSIIIIDDLRMCQSNNDNIQKQQIAYPNVTDVFGYPSITELKNEVLHFNKDYTFIIFGDIGLLIPINVYHDIEISPVLKAMTASRFFEENTEHTTDEINVVLHHERNIMHAQTEEAAAIKALLDPDSRLYIPELFTPHYRLWNGLVLLGEGYYNEAKALFKKAYELGLNHWRVLYYIGYAAQLLGNNEEAKIIFDSIEDILVQDGLSPEFLPKI